MFGQLSWDAIPLDQPIPLITSLVLILVILGVLGFVGFKGYAPYLWREWVTSTDHKRIGVMYCILALVMLIRGFADAIMMRSQQAFAVGQSQGFLPPEHYDQIFSAHGTIMIFFMAMAFLIGLMNFILPLQLGVRDVAFPVMNSVSFWLTASGVLLVNMSLVVGEFARTGWLGFPPLSEKAFSPGVGVDYYLVALQISGIGTLLTGVNFVTTILKIRAPGMSYFRMPVFCWTALVANLLIVAAFPVLTATFSMLMLDRYLGFHFFTNDGGGNSMLYMNLIWIWGHPEVYILALPAFGIFSEVFATFSGKPLFGYRSMVLATLTIGILAFTVWLHHFFTMGAGADVNAVFGIASMLIAIPTGVKVFNWLFTMYGGRVRFSVPMHWALGFVVTFVFGGMTGVLLANPPADFVLHNSLFLVAHFHNVIIGAVVFGIMAGYNYWFPKAFGFTLDERLGKAVFWCWFIGFWLAFMPLYILGLEGATRRMQHYDDPAWQPLMIVALVGALVIFAGIILTIVQLYVSIRTRDRRRDVTGDPWDGRTLEWATLSPPPPFNFAVLPDVHGAEAYWGMKQRALEQGQLAAEPDYEAIEMPRNSPTGVICAFFASFTGFAVIWHIWWLAILGLVGAFATFVWYAWQDEDEQEIGADEVARQDRQRRRILTEILQAGRRPMSGATLGPLLGEDSEDSGLGHRGPESKSIIVPYGFWIFILSDIIMFSALFASYAALIHATAGGPAGKDLFDLRKVAVETVSLLFSSFTCGLAFIAARRGNMLWTQAWLVVTGILGLIFLAIELREFAAMIAEGAGPQRSAFLSAFFTLVGCHGAHITAGLLWIGTMMAQVWVKGFTPRILRRFLCFTLFWHALDIVWVAIFTIVYLVGMAP